MSIQGAVCLGSLGTLCLCPPLCRVRSEAVGGEAQRTHPPQPRRRPRGSDSKQMGHKEKPSLDDSQGPEATEPGSHGTYENETRIFFMALLPIFCSELTRASLAHWVADVSNCLQEPGL